VAYALGNINLALDYELFPTSPQPSMLKLGAEWWLAPVFALRLGSDQDSQETNLTAGLSFLTAGYMFDYAYHQYGNLENNTTHSFSLSYGIFREEKPSVPRSYLRLDSPADRAVLFAEAVTVEGLAQPEVRKLELKGQAATLEERGGFGFRQPLELGKNSLKFKAYDSGGALLQEIRVRVLRLPGYPDVPPDYWAALPIGVLSLNKVISGYPDGTFRPEGGVTRAELLSILAKARGEVSAGPAPAKGKPYARLTRAEGVAIIVRFAKLTGPNVTEAPFPDVPGRFWGAKEILAARAGGLLQYLEGKNFEPKRPLTRAETAAMIAKTEMFSAKVKELLDFEGGY
jgi:hypothetical protein